MAEGRQLPLESGESLRYRADLRNGGEVVLSDQRMFVTGEQQVTSIPFRNISEVTAEAFDWFIAIISGALVLFGLYSLDQHVLVAAAFVLVGLWSLLRTYRKRNLVRIHIHTQAKPIELFPEDVEGLYDQLEPAMDAVRDQDDPK